MSLRDAGGLVGVSHQTVKGWREWLVGGADPDALPAPQRATLDGIESYLRIEADIEARRAALRMAADRLRRTANELDEEASSPDAGISRERVADRVAEALGEHVASRRPDDPSGSQERDASE